ncbi:MAG: carboxypeptidase regulatory-like domain-containing protein, partial [Flavobacterium sp.]|nr:carboxypeptidase regulatory-like domain-containing protein [Flavobacterium sp.]
MSTIKYVNPTIIKTAMLNTPAKPEPAKPVNPAIMSALRMDRMIIKPIAVTLKPLTPIEPKNQIAKITGKIVDSANQAVAVTEIQIMNVKNAATQSVLSLEDGTYTIDNIENGSYEFKIKKTGY